MKRVVVLLLGLALTGVALNVQAVEVFVYGAAGGGVSAPQVSQTPPTSQASSVVIYTGGGQNGYRAYHPNVTYIGGGRSCAPAYYPEYYGGNCNKYAYPHYSPNVVYFGRLEAAQRGYRYGHYR